jgi:hypothetical protein
MVQAISTRRLWREGVETCSIVQIEGINALSIAKFEALAGKEL